MDDTIQLLSSMSPKVKEGYKVAKKGTSVLALKKHFRRSSIFDKQKKTINNDSLIFLESDSANSSDVSSKPRHSFIKNNAEPIEISDSEISEDEVQSTELLPKENAPLSRTKIHDIEKWIDKVDVESNPRINKIMDNTVFSEVSTIFGDDIGGNFQVEGAACAINSTQISTDDRRFDELFRKKQILVKDDDLEKFNFKLGSQEDKNDVNNIDRSLRNLCIEDSFEERINKRNSNERTTKCRRSVDKSVLKDKNDENEDINLEYESVLDSLYGKSWRENKEQVLPKSEPRKANVKKNVAKNVPKTERKPKPQNNLLKNLQTAKVEKKISTPWMAKLKTLCDPESSPSPETTPVKNKQRTKLNFDDTPKEGTASKYFDKKTRADTNDKENSFEFSDLGETLEERIRKKLNNENPLKGKNAKTPKKKEIKQPAGFRDYRDLYVSGSTSSNDSDSLKNVKPVRKKTNKKYADSSSDEWTTDKSDKIAISTKKKSWTFLESLSGNVPIDKIDFSVRIFRTNFKEHRTQLADKLFTLYNKEIFDDTLPEDTPIEWNDRMRGSAGFCYCKKVTRRTGAVERNVRVVLSTKVLDSADRLRDTLVHELCHAATWLVNNVSDGHGPYWKAWASKAMKRFPELPPIKRCHDYVINTKYTYKCSGCSYSIGRHTKSLDIERKRCGYCHGKFEVLINKTSKKGETKSVPVTPKREPTAFAKFVKENYSHFKNPDRKHGDVMRILGQKFGELKTTSA
ncbi:unnamed protein product [Brassicogethes aeneus]|uniref:SprT-like domain-containing protein n=1 Tax=Brassicogethes aeneus TaxID=1431903 RepID=A0A9P0FL88_BRAAE|nr:unnamed protein product [Brassicogethes aeneus]